MKSVTTIQIPCLEWRETRNPASISEPFQAQF